MSLERAAAAFSISALGCLLSGRAVIHQLTARRWIQPIRHEDCPPLLPLQEGKHGTPTMGGLLVLGVAVFVAALFGGLNGREGWLVLMAIAGLGAIGWVDDLMKLRQPNAKGLPVRPKLLAALGIGGVVGWALADPALGYQQVLVPWLGRSITFGIWWIPLAMLVVAGSAHAVNLTDGMDGLAVGCLSIAFVALAALTVMHPWGWDMMPSSATVWCASLAGACIGFLWFNSYPASVFLGDVGALGLGAALGVLALLTHTALALMIVGGVFVAEAVSVMLQVASYRWRNRRRIFRVAPLHHHFHVGGISEQQLVVRFWIVGALLAALGVTALARS